jgi:hypothetical protein
MKMQALSGSGRRLQNYAMQVPLRCIRLPREFATKSIDEILTRKKRDTPPITPIATGDTEARIIALACGDPPKGFSRWTLRLLEEKTVELGIVDRISDNTIGRLLKKHRSNLIKRNVGVFHRNTMPPS